jgi:6-phosphofructokinase 1
MVTLRDNKLGSMPISETAVRMKSVPLTSDTLQTARDIGICMGD